MTGVALGLAAVKVIATLFLCGQRRGGAVGQIGVKFRSERANARGDFVRGDGLAEFVIGLVGARAFGRAEIQWRSIGAEGSGAFRSAAYRGHISGPSNIQ